MPLAVARPIAKALLEPITTLDLAPRPVRILILSCARFWSMGRGRWRWSRLHTARRLAVVMPVAVARPFAKTLLEPITTLALAPRPVRILILSCARFWSMGRGRWRWCRLRVTGAGGDIHIDTREEDFPM